MITLIVAAELNLVETDEDFHFESWHCDGVDAPPDEWWTLGASSSSVAYASKGRLDGEEGDLYYASYEASERVLYIEYYFNF